MSVKRHQRQKIYKACDKVEAKHMASSFYHDIPIFQEAEKQDPQEQQWMVLCPSGFIIFCLPKNLYTYHISEGVVNFPKTRTKCSKP